MWMWAGFSQYEIKIGIKGSWVQLHLSFNTFICHSAYSRFILSIVCNLREVCVCVCAPWPGVLYPVHADCLGESICFQVFLASFCQLWDRKCSHLPSTFRQTSIATQTWCRSFYYMAKVVTLVSPWVQIAMIPVSPAQTLHQLWDRTLCNTLKSHTPVVYVRAVCVIWIQHQLHATIQMIIFKWL